MPRRSPPPGMTPLFGDPPPREEAAPKRSVLAHHKPMWSKYHPVRKVRCDDCMAFLARHHGEGPLSRQARWKRKAGGQVLLLCTAHADVWRERDRMPELKDVAR
jgi:hypothetical protein